jgi:hypothetical protein
METTGPIQMNDIQGLILRGYNYDFIRYIILTIPAVDGAVAGAQKFCSDLLPDSKATGLKITDATPWVNGKPIYCLNIGFTIDGLNLLIGKKNCIALNSASAQLFSPFSGGAVNDAGYVGDTGDSDPKYWWKRSGGWLPDGPDPLPDGTDLHIQLTLYARCPQHREEYYEKLMAMIPETKDGQKCIRPVFLKDSDPIIVDGDPGYIHFGYRDSLSQPRIDKSPWQLTEIISDDDRPKVPADRFIISTKALDYNAHPFLKNGTFAAFRLLYQDVGAFNDFIHSEPTITPPELMAAKMCGRWRDGTPLVVSPNGEDKSLGAPGPKNFNFTNFNYHEPTRNQKGDRSSDDEGLRCPYAAHIRRSNPRDDNQVTLNNDNAVTNRILRRASPYGPPYQEQERIDGVKEVQRGLVGLFIGAVLADSFQFITHSWLESSGFRRNDNSPNLSGVDPLFGPQTNDIYPPDLVFAFNEVTPVIEQPTKYKVIAKSLQRYIRTDGGLYLFMPGVEGLRRISRGSIDFLPVV